MQQLNTEHQEVGPQTQPQGKPKKNRTKHLALHKIRPKEVSFFNLEHELLNLKEQDRQVQSELKFIKALQEVRNGKLPTNEQVETMISNWSLSNLVKLHDLSPDGQKVSKDLDQLGETIRVAIKEKNQDEHFQEFLHHLEKTTETKLKHSDLSKEEVKGRLQNATPERKASVDTSTVLKSAWQLLNNENMRQVLLDFNTLIRETLSSNSRATEKLSYEDSEKLQEEEYDVDTTEATRGSSNGQSSIKSQVGISSTYQEFFDEEGKYQEEKSLYNALGDPDVSKYGHPLSSSTTPRQSPKNLKSQPLKERMFSTSSNPLNKAARKEKPTDELSNLSDNATKETYEHYIDQMPQEKRDELAKRFQQLFSRLHHDTESRKSIQNLKSIIRDFFIASNQALHKLVTEEGHVRRLDRDTRSLMENFQSILENIANKKSLNPLRRLIYEFTQNIRENYVLRQYLFDLDHFVQTSVNDLNYCARDDYINEASEIIRRGREIMIGSYGDTIESLLYETKDYVENLKADSTTMALAQDLSRINRDLFMDPQTGKLTFKFPLMTDLFQVILPAIVKQMKYLPIPHIEYDSHDYHIIAEDIVLDLSQMTPQIVELTFKNRLSLGIKEAFRARAKHSMNIKFYKINMSLMNIPFYFRRKIFPQLKDYGVANAAIGREGICACVKVYIDKNSPNETITLKSVNVFVDKIDLNLHHTSNDSLLRPLSGLIAGILRGKIQESLEDQIVKMVSEMDAPLTSIKNKFVNASEKPKQGKFRDIFSQKGEALVSKSPAKKGPSRGMPLSAPWSSDVFTVGSKGAQ